MKILRLLYFLCGLTLSCTLGAVNNWSDYNYAFRQITVLDGLPNDEVKTLFLVPDGRLGICSSFGLSFYDGSDFRNFPMQPSNRVFSWDYISANPHIYVDRENRVWIKGTKSLAVFDVKKDAYVQNVDSLLKTEGIQGHINNLFITNASGFWWVTDNGRVWYKDIAGAVTPRCFSLSGKGLRDIALFKGLVWFVYENGFVVCADIKNGRILRRERLWNDVVPPRYPVAFRGNGQDFWILWNKGVAFWNNSARVWEKQLIPPAASASTIDLEAVSGGQAWLSVELKGLYLLDGPRKRIVRNIPMMSTMGDNFENDIQSILFNPVNSGLWLGLYTRGLAYFSPSMEMLPMLDFKKLHIAFDNTLQMTRLQDGRLLMITSPQPLVYNPLTRSVTPVFPQLRDKRSIAAYQDSKGRIWVGTFRNGFYEIKDGVTRQHNITTGDGDDILFNLVRGFIEDNKGRLFINFHGGLGLYNEQTQLIEPLYRRHPELKSFFVINKMAKDRMGNFWIASRQGVYKYDPQRDKVWLVRDLTTDETSRRIMESDCKTIFCDSRGLVWLGTNTGLYMWNAKERKMKTVGELPTGVIQAVVEDGEHKVWASTANGLCRISVERKGTSYTCYTQFFERNFRLKDSEFLLNSALADTNGTVYLGCTSGLYVIPPSFVKQVPYRGHPLITSFYLYDKEIVPGQVYNKRVILPNSLIYTKHIRLNYDENFFTIRFSGLSFTNPEHTYYRYRLKGVDKEWIEISPRRGAGVANYTNLSPGTYRFEVFSAGADKKWSKESATLEITIDSPLWATWWAELFYVVVLVGAVFYYLRYREIRNKELMELQKEKELDEMKYRFFTNISHEFRTLLTLIITPLGAVLKKMDNGPLKNELKLVSGNAGDLLLLVNQLLDFRKLEMGGERLSLLNGQIGEFVETVLQKFMPLAEQRAITLSFHDESKGLYMFFDRDKLHKIIDNLLSNAFKFTPSGGSVTVMLRRRPDFIELEVTDTGCGMSEEGMKHIFDRFYRVEKEAGSHIGSGIGLNLVQEYVKLHKGTLRVTSKEGEGSSFFLDLPIDLKPEETAESLEGNDRLQEKTEETHPDSPESSVAVTGKTLLVVEDNDEFRRFLANELSEYYKVLMAADGIRAALVAEEKSPDLIISDIMMPRMNGIDLCKRIKSCLPTSHIPVILLTAKGSDRARAEGYEAGADAYISKPFDMEVLLARIANLLRKQTERRQEFSHSITLDPKEVSITSKDEEFMKQAIACIEKNMADPEYMTDNLASDVAMSRMSLYRKVKAVTGQTPADFIRTVRLKYAARLLKTGGLTVAEVCEKTGFATPQNFTKRFREMFGVLPSQYK